MNHDMYHILHLKIFLLTKLFLFQKYGKNTAILILKKY